MGKSGSLEAFSSVRGHGFTVRSISTGTSIFISITARDTTDLGEHPAEHRQEFHGNAMHDPRGHEAPKGHR